MAKEKNIAAANSVAADDSLESLRQQGGDDTPSINEKALIRRIDYRIIPLMFCCTLMVFLDKIVVNYANVMGLSKDTNLKGNDFAWTATALYIGYGLAQIPQGMLLQKFPANKVLGYNVILWGITVALTAACNNFGSLLALRFILGAFDSVISPALIIVTSMWYLRAEATPRYGIWYNGLGAGQIVGGLLSFAFQYITSTQFAGWRLMFVVVGVMNSSIGVLVLFFLPASPLEAKWLSDEEKIFAVKRLAANQTGVRNSTKAKKHQVWEAVTDPQAWLLCLITVLTFIPSAITSTFSATIIKSYGYDSKQSALLNMPGGAVSIISTMIATIVVRRGYARWACIVGFAIPTLIGGALMSFLPKTNKGGLLTGIYLVNCISPFLVLVFSWAGSNNAGYSKKITVNGMIAASFAIANIIGPQTFQARNAPNYIPAKITILAVAAGAAISAIFLRLLLGVRNRKHEILNSSNMSMSEIEERALADLTDRENKYFRYVY